MSEDTTIVVGADGSSESRAAVQWAAAHAAATGGVLHVVHAVILPTMTGMGWKIDAAMEAGQLLKALDAEGHLLVAREQSRVERRWPAVRVRTAVVPGDPRAVLLDAADDADVLVVGSRGRGPISSLVLGSVSAAVARHSACPTVVHRDALAGARGVLSCTDPAALEFAGAYADAHATELCRIDHTGVDALMAAARSRELLVVARHTRRFGAPRTFDHAITVAEEASCPVAVVAADGDG